MPSTRARYAAYIARARFNRRSRFPRIGQRNKSTGPMRPRGFRAAKLGKYNTHIYKRMATPIWQTAPATSTAYNNVLTFDLSQVRGASELTALYDQYMIVGVKTTFQLMTNPEMTTNLNSSSGTNASNFYPKLFYCRDYDNNAVESTNDLRERNNTKFKVLRPNSTISVYTRPAVRNMIYLDGVTPASSPIWKQWIDCSTTQVPHYGLKYSIDFLGLTTVNDYNIRIEQTYYIRFKNAR